MCDVYWDYDAHNICRLSLFRRVAGDQLLIDLHGDQLTQVLRSCLGFLLGRTVVRTHGI